MLTIEKTSESIAIKYPAGWDTTAEAVKQQLLLLNTLSLNPVTVRTALALLDDGRVLLQFLEYSNPFPIFDVEVGSPDHVQLQEAIQANLRSRRFKAGKLYYKRTNTSITRYFNWLAKLEMRYRRNTPEPDLRNDRTETGIAEATANQLAYGAKLMEYKAALKRNRARRIEALRVASSKVPNLYALYKVLGIADRLN